jgi:hypothetical protein
MRSAHRLRVIAIHGLENGQTQIPAIQNIWSFRGVLHANSFLQVKEGGLQLDLLHSVNAILPSPFGTCKDIKDLLFS